MLWHCKRLLRLLQLGIDAAKRRNWYLLEDLEATKKRMTDLRERILAQSIPHRIITPS